MKGNNISDVGLKNAMSYIAKYKLQNLFNDMRKWQFKTNKLELFF